jgi:MFS family permease
VDADSTRVRRAPLVLLEAGNVVSGIGNGVALVVLPWLVLDLTGSATAAGAVASATLLPLLASSLFAGTIVDIVGRKRVAIVADVLSGVSVAAIPLLGSVDALGIAALVLLAMVGAALDPAGYTAREAMLPGAATAAQWRWDRANGVHEALFGVAYLLGPGLGGILIGWVGALAALWVTAAGFAVSVALTSFLRVAGAGRPHRHERPESFVAGTVEGLRFVWRGRLLRVTTLITCVLVAAYLPFESVILPVFFTGIDAPEQLGWVVTALSGGTVLGSLAYPVLVVRVGRHRLFVVSVVASCLTLVALAALPSFWWMMLLAGLVGLFWGPVQPILNLVMQVLTPERLRGRVIGVVTSVTYAAGPLGLLAAGPLIDAFDVRTTAFAFAATLVAASFLGFLPSLRQLDDLEEPAHPEGPQVVPPAYPNSGAGTLDAGEDPGKKV